ncbi:MAG TPA: hypothetical protein VGK52_10685 [Polyangia bacterium]|jgi:hypothetical protein
MKIGPSAPARPAPAPAPRQARHAPGRSFLEVLGEGTPRRGSPAGPPGSSEGAPVARAATPPPASWAPSPLARGLARALDGAAAGEARLDAILDAAARGKSFTPAELLAVQATVFRYSQTVEVLSRATDRLVGAVKQTLGTQV